MKKKLHNPLHLVNYRCISCQVEYQNYSTIQENKNINSCANCNPAYKGRTSGKTKIVGRAEKFHQRQQTAQKRAKNKTE